MNSKEYNPNHDAYGQFSSVGAALNIADNATHVPREKVHKAMGVLKKHAASLTQRGDHKGAASVMKKIDKMNATLRNKHRSVGSESNTKFLIDAARQIIESDRFSEAAQIISMPPVTPSEMVGGYAHEGHVARVVLITEGLGNRRNMNYYSSDAIMTAPTIFEGKSCYLNHPSESEERDIPERRIQDKCGYFKNCRIETIDGVTACTGELHFDLSEAGRQAFDKARTALHYKTEFPGIDAEYVGLSIHADGDWDDRTIQLDGESLDVKFVTKFTDAVSCDLVTSPARGGRILALVESAAGAIVRQPKEVDQMKDKLKKLMEAARSALRKADEEKEPAKKAELISQARKANDVFLTEASKAAQEEADPKEEKAGDSKGSEAAEPAAEVTPPAEVQESKKKEKDMCADDDAEESDEEDPKAKKKAAKKKDDADDADKVEANRIAVASLLKEAGVVIGAKRTEQLSKLSLREAKESIQMLAEDQKAIVSGVLKLMRIPPVAHNKVTESDRDGESESNNKLFADCFR